MGECIVCTVSECIVCTAAEDPGLAVPDPVHHRRLVGLAVLAKVLRCINVGQPFESCLRCGKVIAGVLGVPLVEKSTERRPS
jgi:hypothetical protein